VDRQAIAREVRRRQILEQLDFERERETALTEQLHEVVVEEEGARVDEAVFASMDPEDVAVVREALGEAGEFEAEFEDEIELADESAEDETVEDEIARLEAELADCGRRQRAFESYLELLGPAAETRSARSTTSR
jgi:hypothetical protein